MKPITYLKGDVTNPQANGNKIIFHCCNNLGVMGAGVALAIKQKWAIVYTEYRKWAKGELDEGELADLPFKLGNVQFVKVEPNIAVANMIGQDGVGYKNNIPPVRYDAVESCLKKVAEVAIKNKASVHGPKICSGLAGGDWNKIEKLIIENLSEKDVEVFIYELE